MPALAGIVRGAVGAGSNRAGINLANLNRRATQIVHDDILPNPTFAGQGDDLDKIDRALWATDRAGAAASSSAAVPGLGGVGKSVLAREYAWCHRALSWRLTAVTISACELAEIVGKMHSVG